jgi:hypothetical protein
VELLFRREDDSRSLLRDLFRSDAGMTPHCGTKIFGISNSYTHQSPFQPRAIQHLIEHLNDTESNFPGTDFRLICTLGDSTNGVT